jgi:endogenous inhibitor of DNA gyrase (YacG/DUF329 family)/phage FluMu protein Com
MRKYKKRYCRRCGDLLAREFRGGRLKQFCPPCRAIRETGVARQSTCIQCRSEFSWRDCGGTPAKYCSKRCCHNAKYTRKRRREDRHWYCVICGSEIERSRKGHHDPHKYCSQRCRSIGSQEKSDAWYELHRDEINAQARERARNRPKAPAAPKRAPCISCGAEIVWLRGPSRKYCSKGCARAAERAHYHEDVDYHEWRTANDRERKRCNFEYRAREAERKRRVALEERALINALLELGWINKDYEIIRDAN